MWCLIHYELPWTANQARVMNRYKLAQNTKNWREAYWALAKQAKVPKMKSAEIHYVSLLKRMSRDLVSEAPSAKAALDGIVDAGVLEDDRPPFVRFVGFHSPMRNSRPGMAMFVVRCE